LIIFIQSFVKKILKPKNVLANNKHPIVLPTYFLTETYHMHNIFILFQKRINSRGYSQNSFAVPPIWSLCSVQLTVILFYSFYTLILIVVFF